MNKSLLYCAVFIVTSCALYSSIAASSNDSSGSGSLAKVPLSDSDYYNDILCRRDSDCPEGTVCISVKIRAGQFISKCTRTPACQLSQAGFCPSFRRDKFFTQCVLVNTTKLRNITCCGGGGTVTVPVDTTPSNKSSRRLGDGPQNCFQCFVDKKGNIYKGQYECIPVDQCSDPSISVFQQACKHTTDCYVAKNNLCNQNGSCYPSDPDDPQFSHKCLCNKGYGGLQCDKIISNECEDECGPGAGIVTGTCVKGTCNCTAPGWGGDQCATCHNESLCYTEQLAASGSGAVTCGLSGNCGTKGTCTRGKCYCKLACVGSQCDPCAEEGCADCSIATVIRTSFEGWLIRSIGIVFVAFVFFA